MTKYKRQKRIYKHLGNMVEGKASFKDFKYQKDLRKEFKKSFPEKSKFLRF